MPATPYLVNINVKDTDNTTNKQGVQCYVRNVTKKTTLATNVVSDASGNAIIDLANLPVAPGQSNPYDAGDSIIAVVFYGNNSDGSLWTVTGGSKNLNYYLNPIRHQKGQSEVLQSITMSNMNAAAKYAKVWALDDGQLLLHVVTPTKSATPVHFPILKASGGFVVEREANDLIVTASIK